MIFRQVQEIIEGKKTQTRRIVKGTENFKRYIPDVDTPMDTVYTEIIKDGDKVGERIKWQVGRKYAVVPKRGQPQVFYLRRGAHNLPTLLAHEAQHSELGSWLDWGKTFEYTPSVCEKPYTWQQNLISKGWNPLYIHLIDIDRQRLQDMSHDDAVAEGVQNRDEYKQLWISINGEQSWYDNPDVWVLEFQVVKS